MSVNLEAAGWVLVFLLGGFLMAAGPVLVFHLYEWALSGVYDTDSELWEPWENGRI